MELNDGLVRKFWKAYKLYYASEIQNPNYGDPGVIT